MDHNRGLEGFALPDTWTISDLASAALVVLAGLTIWREFFAKKRSR